MGSLLVRNLDDALIEALKRRAARHGRSVEAEHRDILTEAVKADQRAEALRTLARLRAETAGTAQTPAEVLVHELRDER